MLLLFLVFLVYNLFIFPYFLYMNYSATHWVKNEAELVNVVTEGKKADVRYFYFYKNEVYFGDKVGFIINGVPEATYFSNKKNGDLINIYMNPKKPEQSVIFVHTTKEVMYDIITRILITFGFFGGYHLSKEQGK